MSNEVAMWPWKVRFAIALALCLCLVVSAGALAGQQREIRKPGGGRGGGGGGKQTPILKLTFDDVYAQQSDGARVLSDEFNSPPVYTDRRWPDGNPDGCVTAIITKTGGAFVHMDRGSGSPSSPLLNDCNGNVIEGGVPIEEARTYTLEFPASSCACEELGLGDEGDGDCSLTIDTRIGAPRISTSSLYKKRDHDANVHFLFKHYGESFDLESEQPLPIINGGDDIRTLEPTYQTFGLTSLDRGGLCATIDLAFSIQFERKENY